MSLVGRLEDLGLSDIFQILSLGRKTGSLIIKAKAGTAIIVFKNGLVVRAEADFLAEDLGDELLKAGVVKDNTLTLARDVKKKLPGKGIGDILYEMGVVTKEGMEKAARKRTERIVYDMLLWQDGSFKFELDELSTEDMAQLPDRGWEITKGISPEYLLMEGARVYDENLHQEEFVSTKEIAPAEGEEWEGWEEKASERKDISALMSLTTELRFPTAVSEITLLVLRFASSIFQRGILFMVDKEDIAGLGQFGLDFEGADERIREVLIPLKASPFFDKIIKGHRVYKGGFERDEGTEFLINQLGAEWPNEIAVFPIVAEAKTVALLYCDNLSTGEPIGETEGLEIFINQAGLALEKSLLEKRLKELEDSKGTA